MNRKAYVAQFGTVLSTLIETEGFQGHTMVHCKVGISETVQIGNIVVPITDRKQHSGLSNRTICDDFQLIISRRRS